MADNVFPQTGDANDAAQFAQLIGQNNLSNFVEKGLRLTPDYSVPEVSVGSGVCFIHTGTSSSSSGTTIEETGYAVQTSSRIVSLSTSSVNYIYVHANLSEQNAPTVEAHTSHQSDDAALHIGTVDTSNDTSTELNRYPTLEGESLTVQKDITATDGTTIWDSSNEYVPQSSIQQGHNSGLDADLLDGVERADISWSDISISQSDIDLSNVGAADTDFDINGYDISDGSAGVTIWDSSNQYIPSQQVEGLVGHYGDTTNPHEVTLEQARIQNDRIDGPLIHGHDPAETITETSSPKSFNFDASTERDIHQSTDVTISNSSDSSVTEDITVELYDGSDTSGTLVTSQTQSISVSAGGSTTTAFIVSDQLLDSGTYHINITQSGSTLSVDQTDENTRGATYTLGQTSTGQFYVRNQYGNDSFWVNPDGDVEMKQGFVLPVGTDMYAE